MLAAAVGLALAFAVTNGLHDASGASLVGAPTSTTQIVASSVVGVGAGRRRWHHVRWTLVRHMGLAWIVTMPASAAIAALALAVLRWGS